MAAYVCGGEYKASKRPNILRSVGTSYTETTSTQSLQHFGWTHPTPVKIIITRAPHSFEPHLVRRLKTLRRMCFLNSILKFLGFLLVYARQAITHQSAFLLCSFEKLVCVLAPKIRRNKGLVATQWGPCQKRGDGDYNPL